MPGRNPDESWRAFRDPIITSVRCVDPGAWLNERLFPDGTRLLATPARGIGFGNALTLTFSFHLEPFQDGAGQWHMSTRRYDYTLATRAHPDEIVFGWHWHPRSRRSHITYPHVHVPSASTFSTRHIPTGRVALEEIILFGFDDLNVPPADATARTRLTEVLERHKLHRRWS